MVTIFHNPKCSKSRQTLALLEKQGVTPEIVEYLKNPPTTKVLKEILQKLGMTPRELIRKKETEYKAFDLNDNSLTDDALITAMTNYPKLIERPIVINKDKAIIGRPPEKVLEIL